MLYPGLGRLHIRDAKIMVDIVQGNNMKDKYLVAPRSLMSFARKNYFLVRPDSSSVSFLKPEFVDWIGSCVEAGWSSVHNFCGQEEQETGVEMGF